MEKWSVSRQGQPILKLAHLHTSSETNLDDVLQISNVFVNVSKGEVAKHGDLKKAFGTVEVSEIVAEVCFPSFVTFYTHHDLI